MTFKKAVHISYTNSRITSNLLGIKNEDYLKLNLEQQFQ